MTETELKNRLKTITQPDEAARKAAHAHWASLAKPLGGLGDLEPLLEDVAALTGAPQFDFSKRAVLVLCADNGVIAQGISQSGSDVTRAVLQNLAQRKTSVCKMAETVHCGVIPVDMGIAGAPVDGVKNCRVRAGTDDFTACPAMTREDALQAIETGIELVREQKAQGIKLLATRRNGHRQHDNLCRRELRFARPCARRNDRPRRGTLRMTVCAARLRSSIKALRLIIPKNRCDRRAVGARRLRYRRAVRRVFGRCSGEYPCHYRRFHQQCGGTVCGTAVPDGD